MEGSLFVTQKDTGDQSGTVDGDVKNPALNPSMDS